MALCAGANGCTCVFTSSTLVITGTGTSADPLVLEGGELTDVATFAALSNPAAMADGTAFFVEEGNEVVVVRDGLYFVPGQKFYEVSGTYTDNTPTGTVGILLVATSAFPPAPVTFSGGAMVMRSFFHPAELTLYAIGPFDKVALEAIGFDLNNMEIVVGGSSYTYIVDTEFERWWDDPDTLSAIPIGRGQNPAGLDEVNNPYLASSGGGVAFQYNVTATAGVTLATPAVVTIGLNWTVVE